MPELPAGTLTLLFTDMEGSTRLLQQVGEHYAALLQECRRLLRTAFGQWHGQEVDTQGDAFFVVFARASDAVCAMVDRSCSRRRRASWWSRAFPRASSCRIW